EQEGRAADGLALAVKANTVLREAPPRERAINAMIRAGMHNRLGQAAEAAAACDEAFALAERAEQSAINENVYRSGFARALTQRLPFTDEAHRLLLQAVALDSQGQPEAAQQSFAAALQRTQQAGDVLTGLRAQMNWAAQLQRVGQVPKAGAMANEVRQLAL